MEKQVSRLYHKLRTDPRSPSQHTFKLVSYTSGTGDAKYPIILLMLIVIGLIVASILMMCFLQVLSGIEFIIPDHLESEDLQTID